MHGGGRGLNNVMAPFYGWDWTILRRQLRGDSYQPLRGESLLLTTTTPEDHGIHFINLGKMKDWVNLRAIQWFGTWDALSGNREIL